MMMNTRRALQENLAVAEQCREELNKLLQQQLQFINDGFADVWRKLNDKKFEFTSKFNNLYKAEDQKFVGIQNSFTEFQREIGAIERVFVELIEFMEESSEA